MDFDVAARRLVRDQTKERRGRRSVELSAQAKQEAERRKQQQAALARQRERDRRQTEYLEGYMKQREQLLGDQRLCTLRATSVYGEGDKIALPPSVLAQLTAPEDYGSRPLDSSLGSTPWTFRVGLRNPEYTFPASPLLKSLPVPEDGGDDSDNHDDEEDDMADTEDDTANAAFLDELSHKYFSYCHATVVEFTQEEGFVGLPASVAAALVDGARQKGVSLSTFRSVDPAGSSNMEEENDTTMNDSEEEKTPGHIAWGAFDLPDMPVEISLVRLPKGRGATLSPSAQAIRDGFYNLEDIKLVLEQSLMRTRATLTVGDIIHTWHRGTKYDLRVSALRPSTYNAVVCLNTDLEVEFGSDASNSATEPTPNTTESAPTGHTLSGMNRSPHSAVVPRESETLLSKLAPEPPKDAQNVCDVQIRSDSGHVRRRFDTATTTVSDLFVLASTVTAEGQFQLVTRFPRRVLSLISDGRLTLQEAGIDSQQELFMIERL